MAEKKKTKFGVFEGELFYARLFEDTMDNAEYHVRTQGQYNTMFVPKDSDELNRLINMGFPEVVLGHQMVKPIAAADDRMGVKLKRPNVHPSGIENFGGAPAVTHGVTSQKWDNIVDGNLGNGTKAKVKVSIYGEGSTAAVRLEKVGVVELVPYQELAEADDRW